MRHFLPGRPTDAPWNGEYVCMYIHRCWDSHVCACNGHASPHSVFTLGLLLASSNFNLISARLFLLPPNIFARLRNRSMMPSRARDQRPIAQDYATPRRGFIRESSDRGPWHDFAISICPTFQLAKHHWLKMHHVGPAERHVGHAKGSNRNVRVFVH